MIMHDKLPKIFILYQLEQSNSRWFDKKYHNYLNNATDIWEFSIKNRVLYNNIPLNKIFYQMTPYYLNNGQSYADNQTDILYDVFFYGAENNRRKSILDKLAEIYNIRIGFGISGNEKDNIIARSKIILNLHFYNDCALEACRLNEILQFNKVIISEKPCESDWYNQSIYEDSVDFIDIINDDLSNINILVEKIRYYLDENNYQVRIDHIRENKIILHQRTKYNLCKNLSNIVNNNLVNNNLVNNNKYLFDYDLKHDKIYCLHLIETPERLNEFKNQNNINIINNITDIEIYPAYKYNPGWKGCALSYVNLMYNANKCNLDSITVCEDDCHFPEDFIDKYNIIKEFLSKINWDMFVGVIANLDHKVEILDVYKYKDITFLRINTMNSTVFNIYNKTCYDKIRNWNINIDKWELNTIDEYFKHINMTFITTYPFYFDCINANSTIWGGKNLFAQYNNMFQKSLNILDNKIKQYKKNIVYL